MWIDLFSSLVTKQEIESLINIYKSITKNLNRMDRLKFRDVLHNSFDMTDDILMDRGLLRLTFAGQELDRIIASIFFLK